MFLKPSGDFSVGILRWQDERREGSKPPTQYEFKVTVIHDKKLNEYAIFRSKPYILDILSEIYEWLQNLAFAPLP